MLLSFVIPYTGTHLEILSPLCYKLPLYWVCSCAGFLASTYGVWIICKQHGFWKEIQHYLWTGEVFTSWRTTNYRMEKIKFQQTWDPLQDIPHRYWMLWNFRNEIEWGKVSTQNEDWWAGNARVFKLSSLLN